MKPFAIGIPSLNRADLLTPFLKLYIQNFPEVKIYIVDNGKQDLYRYIKSFNVVVLEQENNIGVAASWNLLCEEIFKEHENALILNDDIFFNLLTADVENIINTISNGFIRSTKDWAAFIINKNLYEKVGAFDKEFYPAYYEDSDYEHRMKLLRIPFKYHPKMNPIIYNTNMTSAKDASILKLSRNNKQRYIDKWGGDVGREKYSIPFNKKTELV